MQKGVLVQRMLTDSSIQWEAIFTVLQLRGRHRSKLRWRRAVTGGHSATHRVRGPGYRIRSVVPSCAVGLH